jgi:hypothetical protein
MDRAPLGVAAARDQSGLLEDPEMLGDGLLADVVRDRELPYRRVAHGKASHDVASRRVGQRSEQPGQLIRHAPPPQPIG